MITALFMHGAGNEGAGFSWPKVEISNKPENVVGMHWTNMPPGNGGTA